MHGAFSPAKSKENTLPEQVIPEGTAAPETQVETTTESATGEQHEPTTEGDPKPKGGFQRRIDKLTRAAADKEREAEYWRQEALRTKPTETTTEPKGKPQETDFQTHADFLEALTDWKVDSRLKVAETKQNEEKARNYQQTAEQKYRERLQEFRAETPDFDEVMEEATIDVGKAVLAEIRDHEHGPALAYFLAQNLDEAERLSKLNPLALAREVGRLESRFTTTPSIKTATVSKAPRPPTPVSKSSSASSKDPSEITDMTEWRAYRRKQDPDWDRA